MNTKINKIKQIFELEKKMFVTYYIIAIYTIITIYDITCTKALEQGVYMKMNVPLIFVGAIVVALLFVLYDYHKKKGIMNGICFIVLQKYKIKEQYERFVTIKQCIETFEDEDGNCDIWMNVNVIQASIERDQAYSVVYPLMITIVTALFIDKEIIPVTSPLSMILITLVAFAVIELVMIIPRNAFIKRVVECIKKEQKYE